MTAVTTNLPIVYLQDVADLSVFDYNSFPGNFFGECFLITDTPLTSSSEQSVDSSSTYGIEIYGAGLPEPVSPVNFQAFSIEDLGIVENSFNRDLDESTLEVKIFELIIEIAQFFSLESDTGSWVYESVYDLQSDSVILVEDFYNLQSDSTISNEDRYYLESDSNILTEYVYTLVSDGLIKNSAYFSIVSDVNKIAVQSIYSLVSNAILVIEQVHSLTSDANIVYGDVYNLECDASIISLSSYTLTSDVSISKSVTFNLRSSAKVVSEVVFTLASDARVFDPFDTYRLTSDARIVRLLPDGSTTTYNEHVTASPIQYDAKVKEDTLLKIYRRPYV